MLIENKTHHLVDVFDSVTPYNLFAGKTENVERYRIFSIIVACSSPPGL